MLIKLAYLFGGQGGKIQPIDPQIYQDNIDFRHVFQRAFIESGTDYWQMWQDGDQRLSETKIAQPAIFTLSTAFYQAINKQLPKAAALVGLSLGEYSALTAGQSIDWDIAFKLISNRGELMQDASEKFPGSMAAVMSSDIDLIEKSCQKASESTGLKAVPANYNFPKQTVIGGDRRAVSKAVEILKDAGVSRIVPLAVSGAFHTPLMEWANQTFVKKLSQVPFQQSTVPVISNTSGRTFELDNMQELLSRQMIQATRFTDCLSRLNEMGVTDVIELGPGHSLVSFAKKTLKLHGYYAVNDLDSLNKAVYELSASREDS